MSLLDRFILNAQQMPLHNDISNINNLLDIINNVYSPEHVYSLYYENANKEFKAFIGDNEEYKQMYDYCCNILMKHNNDFCGKFTDNILEETHDIMTAHRKDILEIITTNAVFGSDKILDYLDFYQNIFEPIIDQLYKSYKDKKIEMATSLVDKYMKKIEDYSLNDVNCCICLDRINRDEDEDEDNDENNKEKDKYVDLPCKHIGVV